MQPSTPSCVTQGSDHGSPKSQDSFVVVADDEETENSDATEWEAEARGLPKDVEDHESLVDLGRHADGHEADGVDKAQSTFPSLTSQTVGETENDAKGSFQVDTADTAPPVAQSLGVPASGATEDEKSHWKHLNVGCQDSGVQYTIDGAYDNASGCSDRTDAL